MRTTTEPVRVLHVDDEPDFADLAATFLEREDERFEIETATSAAEGVDRLAGGDFDCVVSDYDMPGRNGIEFLEEVRAEHPDLPFILFTGKGSEEVASDAISAGVTDYLQKESGTDQYQLLAKRIRDAIEHRYAKTNYREIFEKTPDGIVVHDPEDGSFTDMNAQFAEMFGYDRAELMDAGFEAIHLDEEPYTLERARRLVEEAADEEPQTFEWCNVTKEGECFWVEVHLTLTQLHGQNRVLAVVRDISDRKERERRFEAVFNNTYTFIGLLEPDGTVVEANETALSFVGADRADVLGKPLWETAWVDASEEAKATVREGVTTARTGEFFRDEIRVRGSEEDALIDFSIRPVFDDRGEVTLLVPEGREITDRKEQARKRRQIIDRVTDAIVEVDADWRFRLVNDQAEELYGMEADDLLGEDFWTVFSEAIDTRFEDVFRTVMETRESDSLVEYFPGLDGWFDVQVYPEGDGGLAFYFQEITERREQSRELEQTRALLDHTEQIADVGGWEIDPEAEDVFWTDHLFEILGVAYEDEPPLEEALDVYLEADRSRVEDAIETAQRRGEPFDVDARFRRPDGEVRWLQIKGEPVVEGGSVVALRGAVQDVTARKERERKLERTEARFRALAENFPNGGVHYFDEDLRYRHVAGAGFDAVDIVPADLEGNTIYEVEAYPPAVIETLESVMEATLDGEHEVTELRFEDQTFELRTVPIRDTEPGVRGGFFITQNITDRRRREAALENQNERLERLAKIISHDLRNPLNVAQGHLELAMEESHNGRLDKAAEALDRSQTLIDDLLAFVRSDEQVGEIEPVDLSEFARTCFRSIQTGDATLTARTDQTVRADRTLLQQLLENLYRNAIEHNDEDIAVTVGSLSDGFYVADTGTGIPEDICERVFEIGYSTADRGTGFGLNIVHQIADAHGWEIELTESAAGGARIEITGVEGASTTE
ncbi:hybrid sensor histidine kinase/response regulator [Halobellus rubicundus]|uniref:histidine kinase n=1 Tax=Halobellus rubicundus TaxID=2996466 RepID=A0ABD5MDQ9_9EURY